MLCKVSSSTVTVNQNIELLNDKTVYAGGDVKDGDIRYRYIQYISDGDYNNVTIKFDYLRYRSSSSMSDNVNEYYAKGEINDTQIFKDGPTSENYTTVTHNNITLNKGDLFKLTTRNYARSQNPSSYYYTIYIKNIIISTYISNISKTIFTHKCLPRQLKEIGNKALGTLFGMHIDNTRYNVENE